MASPQDGVRRRVLWDQEPYGPPQSSAADQEARASLTRFSAEPSVLRGLYNRLTGDDAAAEEAYGRARQTQQEAAQQDSDASTSWRDWNGLGDAAAGVRKVLIGSAPDMALALGAGAAGRGLARRTVGDLERQAAVRQVEQRLANDGVDSLVGRKVAENAARRTPAAATPQVAEAQFQDAIDRTAAGLVRRAPGAQGRIERAGQAGFVAGATAGAFPGIAAQDTEALSQADREGTLRMLPYQLGQAALEPLVEARLAGRLAGNPYVKEALQEGLGATRGALRQLPGRVGKEVVQNAASEAGTEGAQALLQTAGQRAGRGENPLDFTREDWAGALDQAIVGGLAGGAMGGTVEAVNASAPAAVDAVASGARATANAGRWAWDQTGSVREALRERLRSAAERRRGPLNMDDGGADPNAAPAADLGARAGSAAKQAFETASALFDKAKQGATSAAQRFRRAQDDLAQADDLDSATNGAMDWLQANVVDQPGRSPAAQHPIVTSAASPLQAWALAKMNPAYLDALPENEARRLGRAIEKYALNRDLTGAESRLVRDAVGAAASGLSRDMLNASAIVAERVLNPQSQKFSDAEGSAPKLAQPRAAGDTATSAVDVADRQAGDTVGLDVSASDSGDSAAQMGRLTQDLESGFSEQTGATDGISRFDQFLSTRRRVQTLQRELGDAAKDSPEYQQLVQRGAAQKQALRDTLESGASGRSGIVFTRNDASDKSKAFWERKTADKWAIPLLDTKTVTLRDGKTIEQPQAVDLQAAAGRAMSALNAEGTKFENIPPEVALARAIGELEMLGYRIDASKVPLGDMQIGGQTLRVTPRLRRQLLREADGRAYGPWPQRSTIPFVEQQLKAFDNPLDTPRDPGDEYARDDSGGYLQEPDFGEDPSLRARKAPPGAKTRGGFVPTMEVVSDVGFSNPYEKAVQKALREHNKARANGAPPATLRNIAVRHGQTIGALEIRRQAEAGLMNPTRAANEQARLTDPANDGKLALTYLRKATNGELGGGVTVRHMKNDNAEAAAPGEGDRWGLQVDDSMAYNDPPEVPLENFKAARQGEVRSAAIESQPRKTGVGTTAEARIADMGEDLRDTKKREAAATPAQPVAPAKPKRRVVKAKDAAQNDELTDGAKSASAEAGPHSLKAEKSMLNAILDMLGIDTKLDLLKTLDNAPTNGSKGGSYWRGSRKVAINPHLHGAERVEVLMHELGHHIVWNEIAKHVEGGWNAVRGTGLAEGFDALAKGDPKLYTALAKDFDVWNAAGRPLQSPLYRWTRAQNAGKTRTFADNETAFHEWLADNLARSLLGKRKVVGVVGQFFKAIATQLRKAWSVIAGVPELKPAPSVDAWVKQMLDANVAAVQAVTGQAAPVKQAEAAVRGAAAAQAAKAGPLKYTLDNLDDLTRLIDTVLPVESRQLLDRVFSRPAVAMRLRALYAGNDPINTLIREWMDHPANGATNRIAFGYLAWQDGKLKTGPQGQSALLGLGDNVLKLFGAAGDGALAQRTLYDIQTGAVQRFKDAGKTYSARDLAARNGSGFQRSLNWVNRVLEDSPVTNALSAFWDGNYARMRSSGIPAMRQIATMLDRPTGTVGEANPGLITNTRVQTARWNRRVREAVAGLTDRQRLRVVRALQRRAKAGDKAYDALLPQARQAVDTMRQIFRDAHAFQREAGYTDDDLGMVRDYMPVIMDIRNDAARAKLTALYSKPEYARDVVIAAGFVKPDKQGLYDGAALKAATSDPAQVAKAVEYLVRAAANDGQVDQSAKQSGDRFHFRHQNTQLSAFIYRHGNPDDIKTLASLQTKDIGEVFARYFAPMVRWTEMARMFGEPEPALTAAGAPVRNPATGADVWRMNPRAKLDKLLKDIEAQGGTKDDANFADNAVRAALGVYGADGSPTIAAVSPWAAEKLKGRKAQAVIEGVQAYQNARLLPLALLSNLVDPVGIAVRTGGEFNDAWAGFKEGMSFVRATLGKDKEAAQRLLHELESFDISEDFLPALASNPVFEGSRTGKARAVNDFVFKWNGVQTWITATRVMALYAGHKFLLRHAQLPNEHSTRYLQELGLAPADIQEDPQNPGKVVANDKTRAALRQFVDEAILRPNSQQAPLWMSDPYMGIVMQYKMFAYAIWEQIGGRIGRELNQGNMRVVAAALMYLPVIIMAELTREMIQTAGQGDDRRKDWGALEYTKLAADRSGLLGPQYQIMGDIKGDIERSRLPGTSQLGPAIGQSSNVVDALEGRRNLGKEFESALPASPLYRKWNDDAGNAETADAA